MNHALLHASIACLLPAAAFAQQGVRTWTDPRGDAVIRRTDSNPAAQLNPLSRLPDVLALTLSAWQSPTADTDPYSGSVDPSPHPHLFRLDLVFDGLLNPGGTLGDGDEVPYEPFRYGNSPVYGFLELDVDADEDTGGELTGAARTRYLANISRFGRIPPGPLAGRAPIWGTDLDYPFGLNPRGPDHEYRRSGTDFLLSLCGCFNPQIVYEGGNGNHIFDAGETWIVRGPYFQRAGGYREASFCSGGASGVFGMYDPNVNLRFSHSTVTDQTTITLVYALDMIGAGQLAGAPPEPIDYSAGNQTSVVEALQDLIDAANSLPLSGPIWTIAHHWHDADHQDPTAFLDVTRWRVTGLFGTAFATPQSTSNFVWTDTGFDDAPGDVNGDGAGDQADAAIVRDRILHWDGTPLDGDGMAYENGSVLIRDFGANFCLYDVNGDGRIDVNDVRFYCLADFDGDGRLTNHDFSAFLNCYTAGDLRADLNHNGVLDLFDFLAFANVFQAGCP